MLAPAAPGTWPAFWMLPSDNLIKPQPVVAEIDAVELYGHDPTGRVPRPPTSIATEPTVVGRPVRKALRH